MSKIASAYKVEPFYFCVLGNFGDAHLFACCSAVTAMDVQVSYDSHVSAPIPNVASCHFKALLCQRKNCGSVSLLWLFSEPNSPLRQRFKQLPDKLACLLVGYVSVCVNVVLGRR